MKKKTVYIDRSPKTFSATAVKSGQLIKGSILLKHFSQ